MKTIKQNLLLSLVIMLCLSACVKDDIENTFIENFDLLWEIMDENYAGFDVRNVDWNAVRDIYRPMALAAQTEDELFAICSRMIDNELDDGHNSLIDRDGEDFDEDEVEFPLEDIYDLNVIKDNYLEPDYEIFDGDEYFHHVIGMIKDQNIAYLHLFEMEETDGGWEAKMDQFIDDIKDTDGLIIDLRINGGGFTPIGFYIADRFAATEALAFNIQTKNGPAHDDFDDPNPVYIRPEGATQYAKPIAVLTDQFSASNAEDVTIKLITQDHVTHIGETTSGIFSNISLQRFLPNGWSVAFTHQLYTYPDGSSPEGVGISPEIEVLNTPEDWQAGIDQVMQTAIDLLN